LDFSQNGGQRPIGFDQRPDLGAERAVAQSCRQLDTEDLEQSPDLMLDIDAPDMHRTVPTAPEQLCDASRIVLVRLAFGR
jgi:hypothetical protein